MNVHLHSFKTSFRILESASRVYEFIWKELSL